MNVKRMSDEELEQKIEWQQSALAGIHDFNAWFTENPSATKKRAVEQYEQLVGSKDWRLHSLKSAKKSELASKVELVFQRSVESHQTMLNNLLEEQQERAEEKEHMKKQREVASRLLPIFYKYLETNVLPDREAECLQLLIEDGTIVTEEQLAEYGVII